MARLLALAVAVAAAANSSTTTCDIIVRIGYPEGLAPYAVAAPTRWLDGDAQKLLAEPPYSVYQPGLYARFISQDFLRGALATEQVPLDAMPDALPAFVGRRATPHHSSAFLAQGAVAGPDLAGVIVIFTSSPLNTHHHRRDLL